MLLVQVSWRWPATGTQTLSFIHPPYEQNSVCSMMFPESANSLQLDLNPGPQNHAGRALPGGKTSDPSYPYLLH